MAFGEFQSHARPAWSDIVKLLLIVLGAHVFRFLCRVTFRLIVAFSTAALSSSVAQTHVEHMYFRKSLAAPAPMLLSESHRGNLLVRFHRWYRRATDTYQRFRRVSLWITIFADASTIVLYLIAAGQRRITLTVGILTFLLGILFVVLEIIDFVLDLDAKSDKQVLLEPEEIFTAFTVVSMILTGLGSFSYLNFNYFRAWHLFRSVSSLFFVSGVNPLSLQPDQVGAFRPFVIVLVVNLLVVLLLASATFYTVEFLGVVTNVGSIYDENGDPQWNVITGLYFMVVTLTTVGYGDLLASNALSKIFVFFVLSIAVFYIGSKLSTIVSALSTRRLGDGELQAEHTTQSHIVVTGQIVFSSVRSFLQALYSDPANHDLRVVFLTDKFLFSIQEWHQLSGDRFFQKRLVFVRGTPFSSDDRQRSKMRFARAIFVISSRDVTDAIETDTIDTLAISVIREEFPEIPILSLHLFLSTSPNVEDAIFHQARLNRSVELELLKRGISTQSGGERERLKILRAVKSRFNIENALTALEERGHRVNENGSATNRQLKSQGTDVQKFVAAGESICQSSLIVSLLSLGVYCPGASTLIGNLLDELDPGLKPKDEPWRREYKRGASFDFYVWTLPVEVTRRKFGEVARLVYDHTRAIMISILPCEGEESSSPVIADRDYEIPSFAQALVIADAELAERSSQSLRELLNHLRAERGHDQSGRLAERRGSSPLALRRFAKSRSFDNLLLRRKTDPGGEEKEANVPLRDHLVIAGFDSSCVDEMVFFVERVYSIASLSQNSLPRPIIVMVLPGASSDPTLSRLVATYARVKVVDGNPLGISDMSPLNLKDARSVFLFPQEAASILEDEDDGFLTLDVESADTKCIFGTLVNELLLGPRSSTMIHFCLKDLRSLGYCPRPRSSYLRNRLGEPGRTQDNLRQSSPHTGKDKQEEIQVDQDEGDTDWRAFSDPGEDQETKREDEDELHHIRQHASFGSESRASQVTEGESGAGGGQDTSVDPLVVTSLDETSNYARMRYASGQVIVPIIGELLLVRERQIPGLLDVIEAWIGYEDGSCPMLRLFTVPHSHAGGEYGDLVFKVMELGGIALGLYRSGSASVLIPPPQRNEVQRSLSNMMEWAAERVRFTSHTDRNGESERHEWPAGNTLPYVFTNPPPNTKLSSNDGVYVIAKDFRPVVQFFNQMNPAS